MKPWQDDLNKAAKHLQEALNIMYEEANKKDLEVLDVSFNVSLYSHTTMSSRLPVYSIENIMLNATTTL